MKQLAFAISHPAFHLNLVGFRVERKRKRWDTKDICIYSDSAPTRKETNLEFEMPWDN